MRISASSSRAATAAPSSADVPASFTADRFRLTGPSLKLDVRVHAVRGDLADVAHAGRLFAPYYAEALPRSCTATSAMMRAGPAADARAASQLLAGETFQLLDVAGGWAWGYSAHDHYVGYVAAEALGPVIETTQIVTAPLALVFAAPDIKAPVVTQLPLGARVAGAIAGSFLETAAGFIHTRHFGTRERDPIAVATRLLGQPYLWGGRGGGGVDCSGLVQLAFGLCGVALPRDSDQQANAGTEIPDDAPLVRGDLVFFPGHVGIMADAETLLHANAHWMAVTAEPLADVIARLAPTHAQPVTARRRLLP